MVTKEYRVVWEIDVAATSPEAAAEVALDIQRDGDSLATVFTVQADGESYKVDLGGTCNWKPGERRVSDWLPIATAPRDGTCILAANFSEDGKRMYWAATCSYDRAAFSFYVTGPWARRIEASHWMAVPATLDEV